MTGRIGVSTVFVGIAALKDRLEGLSFPTHPDTGTTPEVMLGGEYDQVLAHETVAITRKIPDADAFPQGMGPATKREEYVLEIAVHTHVPDDADGALVRLGDLVGVIETAFRDQTTGQPIPLDLDGREVVGGGISSIDIELPTRADQGYVASATLTLMVQAYI